jgi:hypothetical protein
MTTSRNESVCRVPLEEERTDCGDLVLPILASKNAPNRRFESFESLFGSSNQTTLSTRQIVRHVCAVLLIANIQFRLGGYLFLLTPRAIFNVDYLAMGLLLLFVRDTARVPLYSLVAEKYSQMMLAGSTRFFGGTL